MVYGAIGGCMEEKYEYKIFLTDTEALFFTETGSDYDSWISFIGVLQKLGSPFVIRQTNG